MIRAESDAEVWVNRWKGSNTGWALSRKDGSARGARIADPEERGVKLTEYA